LKILNNTVEIPKYARHPTIEESTRLKFLNIWRFPKGEHLG